MTRILSILVLLLLSVPALGQNVFDGLADVNAARSQKGLRPFVYDPNLAIAAANCVNYRTYYGIGGHITVGSGRNLKVLEYNALPYGSWANATGCGWSSGNDWETCCTFENWTYAGAAWAMGRDGRRYMHIFVRQ